jgi:acetyl-CoA carboxylase beta subunit
MLDMVVERKDLREVIVRLLAFLAESPTPVP